MSRLRREDFCKVNLDLHCLQKPNDSVQTTVYLFETSDATMQICPMTLTLAKVGVNVSKVLHFLKSDLNAINNK